MAAKAKAAAAATKAKAAKHSSKAKGRPKGLQLSSAQAKAYSKAFNSTAQRLRQAAKVQAFAKGLRRYRLQAAHSAVRKYQVTHGNAQAAAVAAHAASMSLAQSRLGHQNAALQHRIGMEAFRHTTMLGRIQYAAAGEKAFAHQAVMRTLTQAQAVSIESKFLAKVSKNAKKAGKSVIKGKGGGNLSKSITARAKAAGLAAAKKTPKGKAAPSGRGRGRPKGSVKGAATQKGKAANIKNNQKAAASSAKAPVKGAKTRTAPRIGEAMAAASQVAAGAAAAYAQAMAGWTGHAAVNSQPPVVTKGSRQDWVGNEFTPNCIVTAIANHMLYAKSVRVTDKEIRELTEMAGDEPTIEGVLWEVWRTGWPGRAVHLSDYREVPEERREEENLVIGFEVKTDDGMQDHCALSREEGKVVSWGEEMTRESPVEEAWELKWSVLKPSRSRFSWRL